MALDFPTPRGPLNGDGALGFIAILLVALNDIAQLLEQLGDLCCLDQWQIGVPNAAPLVVVPARPVAEFRELSHGEVLGLWPRGGFGEGAETFLA